MKEYKSIKTGRVQIVSDDEHKEIVEKGVIDLRRFIITEVNSRSIIPSLKIPTEVQNLPKHKK